VENVYIATTLKRRIKYQMVSFTGGPFGSKPASQANYAEAGLG